MFPARESFLQTQRPGHARRRRMGMQMRVEADQVVLDRRVFARKHPGLLPSSADRDRATQRLKTPPSETGTRPKDLTWHPKRRMQRAPQTRSRRVMAWGAASPETLSSIPRTITGGAPEAALPSEGKRMGLGRAATGGAARGVYSSRKRRVATISLPMQQGLLKSFSEALLRGERVRVAQEAPVSHFISTWP